MMFFLLQTVGYYLFVGAIFAILTGFCLDWDYFKNHPNYKVKRSEAIAKRSEILDDPVTIALAETIFYRAAQIAILTRIVFQWLPLLATGNLTVQVSFDPFVVSIGLTV